MLYAYDSVSKDKVSAIDVAKNNIDEPFRYECLCCGEEVHIAAANSRKIVPHFRHLRGNSDKDCELYLGGLFQTGTGIESAIAVARKRARSHAEILFDIDQQVFYFSISFSEDKIAEYQEGEYELVIKAGSDHSMKPILINQSNFAPDYPVKFPLRLNSNSCCISIRSRLRNGKTITSNYDILKSIEFPTFFKLQSSDSDKTIAKRHTDGIIYTDTNYYLVALDKSHIEKLSSYSPYVSIGSIVEIPALGSKVYGAGIVISSLSADLQETMRYFGYFLRKAERVTLVWPPLYMVDGESKCRPGPVYLTSTFELRPRSNITCDLGQISNDGELYAIDYSGSFRISQANTSLQVSAENNTLPIQNCEPIIESTTIVEVMADPTFYSCGKDGYRLLPPGRYHLSKGTRIIQCKGNYRTKVFMLPESTGITAVKRLMDIRKYYKVMEPYSDDLIAGVQLSKVAEIYIEDCRNRGNINVKALEYIKAGKI